MSAVRLAAGLAGAAVLGLGAGQAGHRATQSKRLTVLAAASLTQVFPRIDARPAYHFAGSNQLAFQIRRGAPADVYAAASPEFTQALWREGLVERPRAFTSSALVLAVPKSNPARVRTVFDLERRPRLRFVIGTAQVPVGAYTRQALRKLRLLGVLSRVVSQESDVKSIVGKLALGEADAGFVYRTDIRPVAAKVRAIALPARAQPKVRYEIAVVRASRRRPEARKFVATLVTSARSRQLLRQSGFGAP